MRRLLSTFVLWALVAGVFMSMQPWAFLGLIGLLTLLATREFGVMLRGGQVPHFPRFALLVTITYSATLYLGLQSDAPILANLELTTIVLLVLGAFGLQLRHPIHGFQAVVAVSSTVFGVIYVAVLFNFTARLIFLTPGDGLVPGAYLLLWLLAVTKFTDMGAYLVGSLIGRHKMIPHVSPAKTWEGIFGALWFAQLAACGLYFAFPVQLSALGGWNHVVLLGFLLAVLAVVGDLAESIIKRSVQAKDSGQMLPGIGGALDLIDSICFTAPALYLYLQWIVQTAP